MMQAQDFTRFFSTQADTFTALARLGQESTEKLVQLHLNSARTGVEAQVNHLKTAAGIKNLQDAASFGQKAVEESVDHLAGFSRQWLEITGQAFKAAIEVTAGTHKG